MTRRIEDFDAFFFQTTKDYEAFFKRSEVFFRMKGIGIRSVIDDTSVTNNFGFRDQSSNASEIGDVQLKRKCDQWWSSKRVTSSREVLMFNTLVCERPSPLVAPRFKGGPNSCHYDTSLNKIPEFSDTN